MATRKTVVPEDEDGLTEITKMHAPRVDLVGGPANGVDFLLVKSAGEPIFTEDDVVALAKRAQEGDMTDKTTPETLTKDVLDPEEITETPETEASGDPEDPTSPAWEAADAARASQALDLTVALKLIVETAQAREAQEALLDTDDDADENVWDLEAVLDAIDCILGVLAPFAVTEQAEADSREADDTIILKSGRVLSGTNQGRIEQAQNLLGEVLSSLPDAVDDMAKSEPLVKADDKAQQMLVYGPKGAVSGPLGSIDPADLTTFVNSADPDGDDDTDAPAADATDAPTADPADDASTDDATAAVDAAPEAPADPADGAVIPGTDTVQAPAEDDTEDVKKGQNTAEMAAALKEVMDPFLKQVGELAGMSELVKSLQERVDSFGRQPDDRRSPLLNGATGAQFVARAVEPVDQLADLRKAVEEAEPTKKVEAQAALAYAAIRSRFGN